MSAKAAASSTSLGTLLGVLFIALKLTHQIDWTWFWVLSPFWIPIVFLLCIAIIALLAVLAGAALKVRPRK